MNAKSMNAKNIVPSRRTAQHEEPQQFTQPSYTLGVRMKFGEELEGLDVHPDGLVFRSPVLLQPGRVIELIVCNGTILVDAIVMHSRPLQDGEGGFAVHVRYHHVSAALSALIREEICRVTGRAADLEG